jgi:ribosomal protein L9
VRLEHPLKALGEHQVAIHVHGDLDAAVTVVVVAEAN